MVEHLCTVCRTREPDRGYVCEPDLTRAVKLLTDLPRKVAALQTQLLPTRRGLADRVTASRPGPPVPARLDVLDRLAHGNDGLSAEAAAAMVHPAIRRWTTRHTVQVTTVAGGVPTTVDRDIVVWHRDLARDEHGQPLTTVDDDQVGGLPPAEWADQWVRAWRRTFGHHVPPIAEQARARSAAKTEHAARIAAFNWAYAAARPATAGPVAALAAAHAMYRQYTADTAAGLTRPGWPSSGDPVADEWQMRFGTATADPQLVADVRYLLTWLPAAAERDDTAVAELITELRAVTADLSRLLGETPDQQWLGRCPTTITDHPDGDGPPPAVRVCGAGLWQEPYASQVVCPRCRSAWGPRKLDLFQLATEIRRAWPLDRRRRYHSDELDDLPRPDCPSCRGPVVIRWRRDTQPGDREPWWRVVDVTCPNRCPAATRLA